MSLLEIQVKTATNIFELTTSGNVMGNICLKVSQRFFPDEGWCDFVVVILSNWLESILQLLKGATKSVSLYFMDGPFHLNIQIDTITQTNIRFVKRTGHREIALAEGHIHLPLFADQVLKAARSTISECKKRNWSCLELDKLHRNVLELQSVLVNPPEKFSDLESI